MGPKAARSAAPGEPGADRLAEIYRSRIQPEPPGGFHVVVVGPVPLDEIVDADGTIEHHYGGATYALAAYAALASGTSDRITLVSHVDPQDASWLGNTFGSDPRVDLSSIRAVVGGGARISLHFEDRENRRGFQRREMAPIRPEDLRPYLEADAFILLPLTATDVPPETIRFLRQNSKGLILLDAHGPLTRIGPSGERKRVAWENPPNYLPYVDVLKMNRSEARLVLGDYPCDEESARAAAQLLDDHLRLIWVTYGDQSSLVVFRRRETGAVYWARVPTVTGIGPVRNTTGAGDAAAAGFTFVYLRSESAALLSTAVGNTVGSLKVLTPGGLGLPPREQVRGLIQEHYGDYLCAVVDDFLSQGGVVVHPIQHRPTPGLDRSPPLAS